MNTPKDPAGTLLSPSPGSPPKPLVCRMVDLIKEFHQSADDMLKKGNDEAHCCMWAAAERLKEECETFITEVKAWRATREENAALTGAEGVRVEGAVMQQEIEK